MANFIALPAIKISPLKSALIKQMIMFSNYKTESERSIKATYEVAKLITEKKKLFSDVKETSFFKCLSFFKDNNKTY